jgi:2-desacetyl-2-hydroxyethyl bacteriochlorophyllide A dehydrogenase
MKSVVCIEPGKIALEERPEPSLASGMVKVHIRRIGVCGTDYHIFKGLHPFLEYPRVMGHELSGEIAEVEEGSRFAIGDKVIVNPYVPCGECIACRKQKPNCCTDISVFGVHADGGMCEFLNVPGSQLYSAGSLSLTQAAMVEFLAIGAHGVRRSELGRGDRVLVVGAGPIGLGAAMFASIAGAQVIMLDVSSDRLKTAESLIVGVKGFVAGGEVESELQAFTEGDLFDVVMDATGNKKAMESSIGYVAHGGSCVFISVVKEDISFADPLFHSREMRLIGSRNATREDFEHVVDCIEKGLIPTDKLNTHSAQLSELPEKIPAWLDDQANLIKAIAHV